LKASGTSVELVNVIVATPRPVKRLAGKLPVGVFIPMTTGKGPVPLGVEIVEVNVIEAPPCVETTVSLPPEKVAVTVLGGKSADSRLRSVSARYPTVKKARAPVSGVSTTDSYENQVRALHR
jgi:hypothetical protein